MKRYTKDQRKWVRGPCGVWVWIVPDRELITENQPDLTRGNPGRIGVTLNYIIDYLSRHGSATAQEMTPPGGSVKQATIGAFLNNNRLLFVSTERDRPGGIKIWRLKEQP